MDKPKTIADLVEMSKQDPTRRHKLYFRRRTIGVGVSPDADGIKLEIAWYVMEGYDDDALSVTGGILPTTTNPQETVSATGKDLGDPKIVALIARAEKEVGMKFPVH